MMRERRSPSARRGLDELLLLERQEARPHDAGDAQPTGEAEHEDDRVLAAAEDVAIATARTMYGMARKMSVRRMITVSLKPPKKPAIAPRNTPMSSDIAVAMMPMRSETRAP